MAVPTVASWSEQGAAHGHLYKQGPMFHRYLSMVHRGRVVFRRVIRKAVAGMFSVRQSVDDPEYRCRMDRWRGMGIAPYRLAQFVLLLRV